MIVDGAFHAYALRLAPSALFETFCCLFVALHCMVGGLVGLVGVDAVGLTSWVLGSTYDTNTN